MRHRLRALHRNERGQIMVFGMLSILFILVIGALATDYAHLFVVDDELEKSMDACALAGAGKLGFDDSAFPAARSFAAHFAEKNVYRAKGSIGDVTLNPNGNATWEAWNDAPNDPPYGEVVLGIWDATKPDGMGIDQRFEPSLDGTRVNAVLCRYKARLSTTLFNVWGFRFFNVGASAIARANPPQLPPPDACVFPIGASACAFQGPTSAGCGTVITVSTSSGKTPLTTAGTNTGGWVSLNDSPPSNQNIKQQILDAANGECANPPDGPLDAGGGVMQDAYKTMFELFQVKYAESDTLTVEKPNSETPAYEGPGWEINIPVIDTPCDGDVPDGNVNATYPIVGWTRMVVTQVVDRGECAVMNPNDHNSHELCEALRSGEPIPDLNNPKSLRAMFGYYDCPYNPSPPRPDAPPRTALSKKLQLVR